MTTQDKVSREDAEALFEEFRSGETEGLRRFEAVLVALKGPTVDYSRESLRDIGRWVRSALRPPAGSPMSFAHLDEGGRELLDGVIAYFAACLRSSFPGLEWRLDTDPKSAFFQRPVLAGEGGFEIYPETPVATKLLASWSAGPTGDQWLVDLFDTWARRLSNKPLEGAETPIDDVEVTPVVGDPDWDAEVWVPEWAEAVLGERVFGELAGRLSGIEGVVDLVWEDRERFLVRLAAGVDLKRLEADVAAVMRAAQADAEGE